MGLQVGELFATLGLNDKEFSKGLSNAQASLSKTANKMAMMGGALTLGLTMPLVKLGKEVFGASVAWESAFTGVRKTIDGTEADYAALEKGIIGMSKTLPASAAEIAGVAEAAGQLGVAKENILTFSKTMIDLGEATDLTSDDAATSLAQFTNITGAVTKYGATAYERLGSVIVDLGNKGASTESQIVAMGMRIAGAGAQVGLTDAQIMGISSALASVGVEAEAGGSAMSTFLSNMNLAVSKGGKDLKKFAKVAGMSSKDFSKMFKDDAAGAMEAFIVGLGKAEDPIKTLSDMGIDDIRMRDALLRLAGAGTLLGDSIDTANSAWSQNSALSEEASKRYATMESVLAMVKNNVTELARQIGDALAPYVMVAAKWVGKLTTFLQGMSPELKDNIVKVGLFAAALGPGMVAISGILKGMSGFIGTFKIALGPVGLLAGGLLALYKLSPKFRNGLKSMTKSGKTFFKSIEQGLNPISSFKFAMQQTFGKVGLKNAEAFLSKLSNGWDNTVTFLKHTGYGLQKAWEAGSAEGGIFGGLAASAKYLWPRLKLAFASGWETVKAAGVKLGSMALEGFGSALTGTSFDGFGKKLIEAALALKEGEKIDFSGLLAAFKAGLIDWRDNTLIPWVESVDWQGMWDAFWNTMLDLSKWLGEPTMYGAGVLFGYLVKLCAQIVKLMSQALVNALGLNPNGPTDQELLDGVLGSPSAMAFSRLGENFWNGVYWAITGKSLSFDEIVLSLQAGFDQLVLDAYNWGKELGVSFVNGMIEDINYVLGKLGIPLIPLIEFQPLEKSDTYESWDAQGIVDYYEKNGDLGQGDAQVDIGATPEFKITDPETDGIQLEDPVKVQADGLLELNIAPGGTFMVGNKTYTASELAGAFGKNGSNGGVSLFTAADKGAAQAVDTSTLQSSGYQIGLYFDKGIASGITAGTSWIKAAAQQAALAAKLAAERALMIASPSKIGIKIGAFFTKGMALGISSLNGAVSRASAGVASLAARGLTYSPVARAALSGAAGGSTGTPIDYDRLAYIVASRPAVLKVNGKELARTTATDNAAASTRREARINAGYGV